MMVVNERNKHTTSATTSEYVFFAYCFCLHLKRILVIIRSQGNKIVEGFVCFFAHAILMAHWYQKVIEC